MRVAAAFCLTLSLHGADGVVPLASRRALWVPSVTAPSITDGVFIPVAGGGGAVNASGPLDGEGLSAAFGEPYGVSVDAALALVYIADTANNALRVASFVGSATPPLFAGDDNVTNVTGVDLWSAAFPNVTTLVGASGVAGFVDGAPGVALLHGPCGVSAWAPAYLPGGVASAVVLADTGNHAVRVVWTSLSTGTVLVATLAGSGAAGFSDGSGTSATFSSPVGIDASGPLILVADALNNRIRALAIDSTVTPGVARVTTLAGGAAAGFTNGVGSAAQFRAPQGVCVDVVAGVAYVTDGNNAVRVLFGVWGPGGATSSGVMVATLAGGSTAGFLDAVGTAALFSSPVGIALDASRNGTLLVADAGNRAVRRVSPVTGTVTTVAGPVEAPSTGYAASFDWPVGVAVQSATNGTVFLVDAGANTTLLMPLPKLALQVEWAAGRPANASGVLEYQQFAVDGLATLEASALAPLGLPLFMVAAQQVMSPVRNDTPPTCGGSFASCAALTNWTHAVPRLDYAATLHSAPAQFAPDFAEMGPYTRGVITTAGFCAGMGVLLVLVFCTTDACVNVRCRKQWTLDEKVAEWEFKDCMGRTCGPRFCFMLLNGLLACSAAAGLYYAIALYDALTAFGTSTRALTAALNAAAVASAAACAPAQRLSASATLLVQLTSGLGAAADAGVLAGNASALQYVAGWGAIAADADAAAGSLSALSAAWTAALDGAAWHGLTWDVASFYVRIAVLAVPSVMGAFAVLSTATLSPSRNCAMNRRCCAPCDLGVALLAWCGTGVFLAMLLVLGDVCSSPSTSFLAVLASAAPAAFAQPGNTYVATYAFYAACRTGGPGSPPSQPPLPLYTQMMMGVAPQSLYLPGGGGAALLPVALAGVEELGNLSIAPLGPFAANTSSAWGARAPQAAILNSAARDLRTLAAREAELLTAASCASVGTPLIAATDALCGTAIFSAAVITLTTAVAAFAMVGVLICAVFLCRFHPGDLRASLASMEQASDGVENVARPRKSGLRYTAEGGRLLVARAVGAFFRGPTRVGPGALQEVAAVEEPGQAVAQIAEPSWAPPRAVEKAPPKVVLSKKAREAAAKAAAAAAAAAAAKTSGNV